MPELNPICRLVNRAPLAAASGQRFWKDLIRVGRWVNPRAGFALDVDRARLERWKANFDAMRTAGLRVPLPWGHSYDPRDNAGFVDALELRDGALWALLDIADPAAAERLGKTVRAVSVSVHPDFVDGSGRRWGEVIEHVALTNYPIVTDQGDFVHAGGAPEPRPVIALELEPDAAPAPHAANSELTNRLYQLELEHAEGEIDDAVRQGKFTRPAAEALRELVAAGVERRYSFGMAGPDLLALATRIIAHTAPGAAVDMAEHTRLHPMQNPDARSMTDARAAQLARENRALAGI